METPVDFYQQKIFINDDVIFPAGETFMTGIVVNVRIHSKNSNMDQVYVLNESGYKKWKYARNVIATKNLKKDLL